MKICVKHSTLLVAISFLSYIYSLGGLFDCQLLCVVLQIFFHDDYESLHEHVSPSALPEDYDGDKPPVDSARLIREFLDPRNDRLSGR